VVLLLVAGLDKYQHLLVNWEKYLAPAVARRLPISGQTFMLVAGLIEILVGLLVALAPRHGGYVVAVWLWCIVANLLLLPGYFDVALRDLGLSLGALALARLSAARAQPIPTADARSAGGVGEAGGAEDEAAPAGAPLSARGSHGDAAGVSVAAATSPPPVVQHLGSQHTWRLVDV
jgi:hypothetical protein